MPDAIVEFAGVAKRFGAIQALKDLSFHVSEGEIFGFIGPNGSGKTTTTRLMLDLYRRDSGEIRLFGLDPAVAFGQIGPRVGVTFDQHALYESLSPEEHLMFWGRLLGQGGGELAERCRFLLEAVGLDGRRRDPVRTFSKGMRQRLAFARSLINRPRFVIMDEPFDGIDVETKRDLVSLLQAVVNEERMTAFLTSHNLVDVERLCHRVAIVKKGAVIACDTTENLRRIAQKRQVLVVTFAESEREEVVLSVAPEGTYNPETRELRVEREPGAGTGDAVVRRFMDRNMPIKSFREEALSLEDIYLKLTGGGKDVCG